MKKLYDRSIGCWLYNCKLNKDSFFSKHYVFWVWFLSSQCQAIGLFAINEILLNDLLGIGFNTDFLDLGFKIKQINAILPSLFYFSPFGIFNYFYFVRGNRYLELMEKYKDEKKTTAFLIIVFPFILLVVVLIIHFLVKNHLI